MKKTNRLIAAVTIMLVAYGGLVVTKYPEGSRSDEIFPFFSWDLFSRVPDRHRVDYDIQMLELNGNALPEPTYFAKTPFIVQAKAPAAIQVINRFGSAVERGDTERIAAERSLFEGRFLEGLETAKYQVVRTRYDILRRVECDCIQEETVLEEFEHG